MTYKDFLGKLHSSTKRDYIARVTDPDFPKAKAAELAKKFDYDYWDGDRRICYGGYKYIEGRWKSVAEDFIEHYKLTDNSKILDIGCGKGFLLYELKKLNPTFEVRGIDISNYAISNSKPEIKKFVQIGSSDALPWEDDYFDFAYSINTLHCLHASQLEKSLHEIQRISKSKYICVESYRNETEKANLLYWQVTCEAFHNPDSWSWWFNKTSYTGDHSFIYFE